MNTKNLKRWAVIRKTSGRVLRSFASREAARDFKRNTPGNVGLFDNTNQVAVR